MKTIFKGNALALLWVSTVIMCVLGAFAFAHAQTATVAEQMSPGDSGQQVSALQTFLATDSSIYPEGLVTGFYGELTTAAVQRFQCKNGIVCSGDVVSSGYGRVGPVTLVRIETQEGAPAGADVNAPVLSDPTVITTSNSAAIHWTTNESARSRVMYGLFSPFLYDTAPSTSDTTFDTSSDVTLSGLAPNTVYYYVLESVDASGNLQWSINHSFRTNP